MRVSRFLSTKIQDLLDIFPVVVLVGVRQAGKTTLCREIQPDWRYLDLEKGSDFDLIDQDPGLFLRQNPKDVIFDEAQLMPKLFSELRHAIDQDRAKKGRYLISGSSSPALIESISESLAGRAATVEVGTLKMAERYQTECSPLYKAFEEGDISEFPSDWKSSLSDEHVLEHWLTGGYPEPVLSNDSYFFETWLDEYIGRYIERDLVTQFPTLNMQRYRKFVSLLANLTCKQINYSDIGRTLDVSSPTTKDYLDIAAGTFIWRTMYSFERRVAKAVVKMPKGYLRDTGLLHHLLKIGSLEQLQSHPVAGLSFEAFVIEELLKGLQGSRLTSWSAHHYRTRGGTEIDLIIDSKKGVVPVEVKYSSKIDSKAIGTLKKFVAEHKSPFGLLINNGERLETLGGNVYQVPVRDL